MPATPGTSERDSFFTLEWPLQAVSISSKQLLLKHCCLRSAPPICMRVIHITRPTCAFRGHLGLYNCSNALRTGSFALLRLRWVFYSMYLRQRSPIPRTSVFVHHDSLANLRSNQRSSLSSDRVWILTQASLSMGDDTLNSVWPQQC
jgi:hypothetical protein